MSRSDTFHLRWRGRVTGPHTWPEVERKLDAHEIGLLHDLQYNQEWTTLGEFLAQRSEVKRVAPNAATAPPTRATDFQVGASPDKRPDAPQRWIFIALGLVAGFVGAHDFYAQHWIRGSILLVIAFLFWRLDWGIIWPWLWAIGEIILLKIDGKGRRMAWPPRFPKSNSSDTRPPPLP